MYPYLLDFGFHQLPLLGRTHLALPTYGVLFALGTLAAWFWFMRRSRKLGHPEELLFNLSFYTLLSGLLGAKLVLILVDLPHYLRNPAEILGTIRTAGVLMGGIVIAGTVFVLYCRKHRMEVWPLADAIAAPLALAQAVGRLGCLAAGCCHGKITDGWLYIVFHHEAAAMDSGFLGQHLVPTQLIEFTFDLVLVCILTALYRKRLAPAGTVFWLYALLYSFSRFLIEFWRGDQQRNLWFLESVSTSQILSVAAMLFAVFMIVRLRSRETT
jgi:phosphatidylglycerol:prolipoprotein diacylglycerol transferase